MGTTTTNLGLYKPAVGETGWGTLVDGNFDTLDTAFLPVVDIRAYGASTGATAATNTTAINNAIAALPAAGGRVYFPAGVFQITAGSITVQDKENIYWVGVGAQHCLYTAAPTKGTVLKATAGSGVMVNWGAVSAAQWIQGGGIQGMAFDGNGVADTALKVTSVFRGQWQDIHIHNCLVSGLATTSVSLAGANACQGNEFQTITINVADQLNAKGITLDSFDPTGVSGNSSFNHFQNIALYTKNGTALQIADGDNNHFKRVQINRSGTAIAIDLLGANSASSFAGYARFNVFDHIDPGAGSIQSRSVGWTYPAQNNFLLLSRDNSAADPVMEAGSTLYWMDTSGTAHLGPTSRRSDYLHELGLIALAGESTGQASPTSQVVYGGAVYLYAGEVVTNIVVWVQTAASGTAPTALKLGLWSSAATPVCLAVTADLASDARWTSQAAKACALTSPYTVPTSGLYYPCFWMNGAFGTTNLQLIIVNGLGQGGQPLSGKRQSYGSVKNPATTMAVSDTGTYGSAGNVPVFGVS